jgi:excisionase family DNA binding protein
MAVATVTRKELRRKPEIVSILSILTDQEIEAMTMVYRDGMTQQEAAGALGVSQPTIHRLLASIHKKAIDAHATGGLILEMPRCL